MKEEHKIKYKVAISIIFGLLGFAANFYTISFPFPPYTAVVLIGLLFPMLITLTWGWKYGLLSALVGGCQSMWWLWGPSNGYATFFVVPPFTLWILWHGLFAGWRRKHKEHGWWLNTYAVEIPFRILSTVNLYTLSRWAITLNPPAWSWASDAPNMIPLHFSNFVVVKQAVVGYVILLLADVLLSFGFIRRFFRLKEDYSQASTGYIISASLLLGVLFWVFDSALDYFRFHTGEGSFLDLMALNVPPDELFERAAFILACLAGGVLSSRFLRRQRQAEAAIRESEERFRTLVETAPSLLQICDKEGNNIYVSPNCEEMIGFTQKELLGGAAWWVDEENASRAEKFFERAFCEELGGRNFEYQAVKKNGELWYASSSWEPFRDEEGRLKGVIFQTIDITERARAEEALAASEALYRSTIDALDDSVQVVNTNLEITLLNEAFVQWAELAGVEMADVIGRNLFQVLPFLSDRTCDEYRRVFETGEMLVTEGIARLAGRDSITETRKIPVFKDASVDRVVTVVRDITERARAEEKLKQTVTELERSNADLTRFNRLVVGRELRMVELKQRINELSEELGREPPYDVSFAS